MPYGYVPKKTIKRIFQDNWDEFLRHHKDKIPKDMQPSVIEAVNKMLQLLSTSHRHLVFTIPEQLRSKIYWNRDLLKVLSDTAARVVMENIQDVTAGIITVVHTFGRDLGFNPHVHVLVTDGGFDSNAKWLGVYFLAYSKLRKQWRYYLLTELRKHLPKRKELSKLIDRLFVEYPNSNPNYSNRQYSQNPLF